MPFPRESIAQDFGYVPHHIVKESYLLHSGPEHDRPCYDQSSVLYAAFPERGFFGLSQSGVVKVEDDGFTRFVLPNKQGKGRQRDRFLISDRNQAVRALEAIVQFTSIKPQRHSE